MDEGRLVEFDEPFLLLKTKTSVFTQLVEQTGPKSAEVLRETARQAYELRHDDTLQDVHNAPDDGTAVLNELDEPNGRCEDYNDDNMPDIVVEDASESKSNEELDTRHDDSNTRNVNHDNVDSHQDDDSSTVDHVDDSNTSNVNHDNVESHQNDDSSTVDDVDDSNTPLI